MENTKTLKQYLGNQTTREIATAAFLNQHFIIRVKRSAGIGCVTGQLREHKGKKWESFTGRFGEDSTVGHFLAHIVKFNLKDGTVLFPDDATGILEASL